MIKQEGQSLWAEARTRFIQNRMSVVGGALVSICAVLCFAAPWIAPYDYTAQDLVLGPVPPCVEHWFGTDQHGRDLLTRVLYGGRISFSVGLIATVTAMLIGVTYGMISGFYGGVIDRVMMRIVEIIAALPFVIFVILLMVLFGREFWLMFVAIGAVEWLTMARVVRGQVLDVKNQPFVTASKTLGQSNIKILWKHIFPNIIGTVIVYATLTIPSVMLLEAFISFLGLGVSAPDTSWGDLIKNGADVMEEYPWILIFPSIFFSLTLFCLNFLGDGLRDALDPKRGMR